MSNPELQFSAAKISQLAKYVLGIERRLNELNEKFNNRPELQQLDSLHSSLAAIEQQLNERVAVPKASTEVVALPAQVAADVNETQQQSPVLPSEYQLVFERSKGISVLLEALETAQQRLIIVCPGFNNSSIDVALIQKFRNCLERNCRIDIGWGYLSDRTNPGKGWQLEALEDLKQLEKDYPEQFRLKLLVTNERFLVCDRSFALLGSHNLLTHDAQSSVRELGIRIVNLLIIQELIDCFDNAVEIHDTGEGQIDSFIENSSANFENYDIELDAEEDTDDSTENSQEPAISAEDFLQRLNQGEKNFAGINLAKANLVIIFQGFNKLNFTQANLAKTELNKANLYAINFSRANLRKADLSETQLLGITFTEADLECADLRKAKLSKTNLEKANLKRASLSGADLSSEVNLNKANLSGANFCQSNLKGAKLIEADLNHSNLSNANLLNANLEGANLQGIKLQQALCNAATIFPTGFDPVKLGACFIVPNASLSSANLAGADLSLVNLTGADLQEGNLNSANLSNADLSEANLSKASLIKANLTCTKLLQANLSTANLSDANLNCTNLTAADLSGANLIQANLDGANLTAANLSQANLKNTNLRRANFSGAILTKVNLVGVSFQGNLSGADLSGANLCGASLSGANLSGANLTSSDLRGADLSNANLEKANLKEAKLGGANLSQAKLSGATMPDGTVHD
jgi:uncharacterized protein YjbI with pentapeptide repeats